MQSSRGGLTGLPRGRPAAPNARWSTPTRRIRQFISAGSVVLMAMLMAATVTSPAGAAPTASARVDKQVLTEIAAKGSTQFLVYLKDTADLSQAKFQTGKVARGDYVVRQLTSTATSSQQGITSLLKGAGLKYQSYWIANAIAVTGDQKLLDTLGARNDVSSIEAVKQRPLIQPKDRQPDAAINAVEWGVQNIQAPRVWTELGDRGEGIVVANIDSGVEYTHPAVVNSYRGNLGGGVFDHNYNWFDPSQVCGTPSLAPCDNNDHGTHTMGTMVGDDGGANQIGVAPRAKWIAAKGCELSSCSDTALLASGQWVLAPTDLQNANPRPDLRPDIVNNSWGGGQGDTFYRSTVQAWIAAGIMPIFSNGNDGPGCDTANSPADNPEMYGVGGYDINNNIYVFSSRGTSQFDGAIKPNISAPAVNVRSSVPGNSYAGFSGTSMAAPHVSGTVALIWSASPSLRGDVAATRALLDRTATDVDSLGCGGTVAFNNNFGEGRLNAWEAVFQAPRGPNGRITGKVTDSATGSPIAGATVTAESLTATTGADGNYALTVAVGDHTVTASKFGYATQTATVTVPEGSVVTKNFALAPLPVVTVSGKVLDGSGHGYPLYAKIEVAGRPGAPIFTNPATGAYSFTVPGSTTYTLTTTAQYPGYQAKTENVVVGTANVTKNISLTVAPSCTAAGYTVNLGSPVLSQNFDGPGIPAGWTTVKRNAGGAEWAFDDPGARGNLTGGAGGFAIGDSDFAGSGTTTDTDLVTPTLDFTSILAPTLRFNSDFRDIGAEDFTDVDYSLDGGTTWSNVYHQVDSRRGPRVEEVSLLAAAGKPSVKLRFHYFGTWDWWWQIDNLAIVNRSCDPIPGGLVVGFTTDANTGGALNGVTVTSNDATADKGVSAPTPDDPAIADGFYWLFSSVTGSHPFTASKAPYQPLTKSVNVVGNGTVKADFALKASRLTVTPTSIEAFQQLGTTRTTNVTVKNTGTAPATVEILERDGSFNILGRQGAPLRTVKVPGGVPHEMKAKGPWPIVKRSNEVAAIGTSWTNIENTPAPAADNSAAWLNGKIYSVGDPDATTDSFIVFDPTTGHWTSGPDLPRGRAKPQVAGLGGKLYVFGGWDSGGTPLPQVDVYDPATNAWSTLAVTNSKARAAAGTAVVNGKVYLVGGCINGDCAESADTVRFDPAGGGAFADVAPYPHTVSWMGCGGVGSRAYCAGGVAASSFTDGFSYDPGSDSWSPIAEMPVDIWAPQEASAGGMLIFAGGIANGSSELTNRTIGYDVATNTWADLPNVNFPRARGAGACGIYKVGGWDAPFSPAPQAENLSGLDQCADVSDVRWLSENPSTFTLAPGASKVVKVTLAATTEAGVLQPGDYTADILLRSDSPYPVDNVHVTMHVTPPPSWGKITGKVQGQSCAGNVVGIPAQLQLNQTNNPDIGYSLKANPDGTYVLWLKNGRFTMIVSKDGWVAQVKNVKVEAGFVLTQDFLLKPFGGCTTSGRGANV